MVCLAAGTIDKVDSCSCKNTLESSAGKFNQTGKVEVFMEVCLYNECITHYKSTNLI